MAKPTKPWITILTYKTKKGPIEVTHLHDDVADVSGLIEAGPSFESLISAHTEHNALSVGKLKNLEDTLSA